MEVDEEAATKAKPWHQGPHFDEAGWPLPMADEPVPIAGPQKEHNPLVVDEIDEFVADGVRAWKEYMATPKEDRETYKVGLPVGEKDWLARLTYGGATHDEKTLEVLKGLDYLKDLPVEPEFEHMNPEVAAHFQAKKDKYWQDASDKIDEALKSFEGLDRDVAKIEREREGIEIPCQDGGSWDWEVYRREEWYRREQRKEAVAKAEAEGTPPPPEEGDVEFSLPKPDAAELEEFLKKERLTGAELKTEAELDLRAATYNTMRIVLDMEAAAHAAYQASEKNGDKLPFPCSMRTMPDDFPKDAPFPYDWRDAKPSGMSSSDDDDEAPGGDAKMDESTTEKRAREE